jgi:uncharacterized protein (TIGR02001 family)
MKKSVKWCGMGLMCVLALGAVAKGDPPSVALDVPVLSSYVWRGQTLSDRPVIQPSLTASKNGFALNTWANYNLDGAYQADFSEIDLTASYSKSVGPAALGVGIVQYAFPNQTLAVDDGEDVGYPSTAEVYVSAGLPDVPLAPVATVYYDVDEIDGFYGMLAIGHSFELTDKVSLAASASLGAGDGDYNAGYFGVDEAALNDVTVGVALPIAVLENLTVKPALSYVFLPDSEIGDAAKAVYGEDDRLVGSLVASYAF